MIPAAATPSRTFGARRIPPPLPAPQPAARLWNAAVPSWLDWLKSLALRLTGEALKFLARRPAPTPAAAAAKARVRALLYSEIRDTVPRLLAYVAALALLAWGTAEFFRAVPVAAAVEPVSPPEWIAVAKPLPAFALSMPELADAEFSYDIRRHSQGGGRKDVMTWGELNGTGSHFMVEVYRPGTEFTRFADAAREIAARTDGLVSANSVKPADALDSKFGSVSLVEFSTASDGTRQCLGFVRPFDHPHLQVAGWYCAGGPELIDRGVIACALDRLTLLAAGSDSKVGELFARAELKRNFCGQRSLLLAATPKRAAGPAPAPETKLRGRISPR
jgi:hypothetical protein